MSDDAKNGAPVERSSLDTHRIIQGREDTYSIPRSQIGVPLSEYFQNAEMPPDLRSALVYQTPKGPVLAEPDPVAWDQRHDVKAAEYAAALKNQIEEKGYYAKTMGLYADRLAKETGRTSLETKAVIVREFRTANAGKDPYTYLKDLRAAQGLPTQDGPKRSASPVRER